LNPPNFWHLLRFIIILVLPLSILGCAVGPTKPNPPYAGNTYPTVLNELAQANPLLGNELGKLPELQDGISETEMSALGDIVELYKSDPANFVNVFNEMYKVGLPKSRKYCSPLQALYWLVEDGKIDTFHTQIEDYSLNKLLYASWDFNEPDKNIERWSDFNSVTDRLNAPKLLNFYINGNIYYKKNRTNSHTPKHTFVHRWGDCDDLSVFGKYILRKAGYKANTRYVLWTHDRRGHVGVVIKLDDGRYFIAVDFTGKNTMSGPYKISDVDIVLSRQHGFYESGWWQQPR
jgi:hypothetical protein